MSNLIIVRQSTSLSSYQPPLKIIVGWILIDLFHLTLSFGIEDLDLNLFEIGIFPSLVKIEFADYMGLANYLLDIMQCKLEME